jgi:hypothetical protein
MLTGEEYKQYIASLRPTGEILVCWNVAYMVFVHECNYDLSLISQAIADFKLTEFQAKSMYILEKLGCVAFCVFDGFKITFCMTDLDLYKTRLKNWRFQYREFETWLKKKVKNNE